MGIHSLLNINNYYVSYGNNKEDWILKDVTLNFSGGECIGIIGNNGSGKSTFAHALLGIIPHITPGQVKGNVFLNNTNIIPLKITERLKYIGYSFQDVESQILFGTVADIIGINEKISDNNLISKAIEYLEISHLIKRTPEELSGGERQRIALITALRVGPKLILYDEATTALDPQARIIFKQLVNYLKKENKIVVLIGQRYEMLSPYCDKFFILQNGSLNLLNSANIKLQYSIAYAENFWDSVNEDSKEKQYLNSDLCLREISFKRKKTGFNFGPLDIDIAPGETIALVGPNGSGKTTFLLLLSGLLKASFGYYILNRKQYKLSKRKNLLQKTVMVTQSPFSQIIGTSIQEELSYSEGTLKIIEDPIKREQLLSHFPYLEFQKDPLQLSYGQQRMLTLLCALLSNTPILLIDEPEQGLDDMSLNYIKTWLLKNRNMRKKTVIFSTHDLELAASIANRCFLLLEGKLKSQIVANIKKEKLEKWYFGHTGIFKNA